MRYILTEDEKRKLREKYQANVNRLNGFLEDGLKIRPNLRALNRRLNNPKIQRLYKKGMEIAEKRNKRMEIATELLGKYKHLEKPGRSYLLPRTISHFIDERPGAEKYNEAIIKAYYLHPEALAQYGYQKAMELNPGDLIKISKSNDADNLFLEYYDRNRIACDFAITLKDGYTDRNMLSDGARTYLNSIKSAYETINTTGFLAANITENYFTFPKLNDEQRLSLDEIPMGEEEERKLSADVSNTMTIYQTDIMMNDIKKFAKKLEDGHYDIDKPGAFSTYVAKDKKTQKYVSFGEILLGNIKNDDADIIKLDDETSKDIRKFYARDYIAEEDVKFPKPMPKNIIAEYMNEFRYRYAINNNKPLYKLEEKSLSNMLKGIRRGFFETIFTSTSDYTKRLQEVIEEFENPRSEDYQNKEKLKEAAKAYLDHRGVHNREEALRESSAARNRSLLCLDIVAAADALKDNVPVNLNEHDNKINDNKINDKKDLFVDPEVILNDKAQEDVIRENNRRKPMDELRIHIKEDLEYDKDAFIGDIKADEEYELDPDFNIIDEQKIIDK